MKKSLLWLASLSFALVLTGCPDKPVPTPEPEPEPEIKAEANFTYAADGLQVTFTNTSKNATKYTWNFGDGETSTDQNPTHTYAASGEYEVSLKAVTATGTSNTKKETIKVAGKAFVAFTYEAGFGRLINFSGAACENVDPASAVWDFGDGTKDESHTLEVSHDYTADGSFDVTLTVNDLLGVPQSYKTSITVEGDFNLLQGSGMDANDEQYWSMFQICENNTKRYIEYEFGCVTDGPAAGDGGCLRAFDWDEDGWQCTHMFLYQQVDVEEGKTYKISLDYKVPALSCTAMCGIRIYFASTDPAKLRQAEYPEPGNEYPGFRSAGEFSSLRTAALYTEDTWEAADTSYEGTIVAPETGSIYFGLNILFGERDHQGDWFIDNVKFELVPDAEVAE